MTVNELLDRMSMDELAEWMAYYEIEPFGESWKQTAYICSMVGNAAGGKKGGRPFQPDEFLPAKSRPRHRRMSGDEILSVFRLMAAKQPCPSLAR